MPDVRGQPPRTIPRDVPREEQRVIKDKVVVRDDDAMSGPIVLGMIVALLLIGGALLYAFSGPSKTDTPPATSTQRTPAPTLAPISPPAPAPAPKAQ